MKNNLCLAGFYGLLLVFAVLFREHEAKRCRYESDCRSDECCMTRSFLTGGCRPYGVEGSPCQPEARKSHMGDMYMKVCPCGKGLKCVGVPTQIEDTVVYVNATCRKVDDLNTDEPTLNESR